MEASRGVPPKLVGACSGGRSLCREKGRSTMRQKIGGNRRPNWTGGRSEALGRSGVRMNIHRRFVSVCSVKHMLMRVAAAAVMFAVTQPMWSQSPKHPLDGLTSREIWTAQEVLQASGKVDEKTQYPMVQLKEAPKEEVLAWKPGQA